MPFSPDRYSVAGDRIKAESIDEKQETEGEHIVASCIAGMSCSPDSDSDVRSQLQRTRDVATSLGGSQENMSKVLIAHPRFHLSKSRRSAPLQRVAQQGIRKQRKVQANLYCAVCNVECGGSRQLQDHNRSRKHIRKVTLPSSYHCDVCDRDFFSPEDFDRHNNGKKHFEKTNKIKIEEIYP